jgi:CBS domain-containing protein
MRTLHDAKPALQLTLDARTAADLMTPNPLSIRQSALVREAATFLAVRGISAAPVIDDAGHPVGVVSRTDILVRAGQRAVYQVGSPEFDGRQKQTGTCEESPAGAPPVEATGRTTVRDVMTPIVFCVRPETAAAKVVEKMLALNVRRLFVVDRENILVGVISTFDVLRKLCLRGRADERTWTATRWRGGSGGK